MQNQMIENAALMLIAANGETTTLDIKNFLRQSFPQFPIRQHEVSTYMIDLEQSASVPNLKFTTKRTNGIEHRVYYIDQIKTPNPIQTVNNQPNKPLGQGLFAQIISLQTKVKQYQITYNGKNLVADKITLQTEIETYNLPFRYSKSKDEFQNLEEINIWHLVSIFNKDLAACSSKNEQMAFMQSIVAQTLVLRYSEVMASYVTGAPVIGN